MQASQDVLYFRPRSCADKWFVPSHDKTPLRMSIYMAHLLRLVIPINGIELVNAECIDPSISNVISLADQIEKVPQILTDRQ